MFSMLLVGLISGSERGNMTSARARLNEARSIRNERILVCHGLLPVDATIQGSTSVRLPPPSTAACPPTAPGVP